MAVSMSVAMMTALIMQGVIGDLSLKLERKTKDAILMIVLGMAFFLNIITINLSLSIIDELVILGCIILGVGAFFYILSIFTLHRKNTSKIVDNGLYGIIRHPMYFGAIVMFFSHIFLSQSWIVVFGTIVAIVCCYMIILSDEEQCIEKFSDDYRHYMEKVPRLNIVLGIIRTLQHRSD